MYIKQNFNNCIFNPLTEEPMLSEYPQLSEIVKPEWIDAHTDSILRYIVCVYDPKSPLMKNEPDLNYRKGVAADLASMDPDEEFRNMVFGFTYPYGEERPPFLPELVFEFLRRFGKSKDFAAIVAIEFKFWEQIKQIITPITGKNSKEELEAVQKKSLVSNEIEIDLRRIESYYSKFFGEDTAFQEKARNRFTPEKIGGAK